jgi:hypothetical protein
MELTAHAQERKQQRGIPMEVLEVLLEFGEVRSRHGADVVYMTKRTRAEARRSLGRLAYSRVADRLKVYAVQGLDGQIVTCGKRLRRLKF